MPATFLNLLCRLCSADSAVGLTLSCGAMLLLGITGPAVAQEEGLKQPSARQQLQHIHTPESIDQELARLTKDLALTPKQQQQVRPLLQEHHDKIQALLDKNPKASRQDIAPQIHAISDQTHRQIHALLTDQQKELEKAMQQREHRGKENRRSAPPAAKSPESSFPDLQEMAGEYVSPSQVVPTGKAPKMLVQLLNPGEATKQYAVVFYQGDEAFSGLLEFAEKYQVTSAHFTAIGALDEATLGWFDPQRKMYKKIPIVGQHEVIGMSGDIALYQGKPVVHTHMMVGSRDGTARRPCSHCVCFPD